MVHEDNRFTFTMKLIINLEMIDCLEWHGLLLRFFSLLCSPSTRGLKVGASLRIKRSILQKSLGFLGLGFSFGYKAPLPFLAIFHLESGLFQNEFIVSGIGFKTLTRASSLP
jgi:hypothetical protein